jgi:hypothetical protein
MYYSFWKSCCIGLCSPVTCGGRDSLITGYYLIYLHSELNYMYIVCSRSSNQILLKSVREGDENYGKALCNPA